MTSTSAFHAARIFDGTTWHTNAALLVAQGRVAGIVPATDAPKGTQVAGAIVPGLVDLQVNGGGGVLFNNDLSTDAIGAICTAHAQFGTTAVMVTLITDTAQSTVTAINAGHAALNTPGFLGLHLEGPHLDLARKGTHDPALIRQMDACDLAVLVSAAQGVDHLICTVAPESVTTHQVAALARAGITVSLGHTGCDHATARAYADAGATMVTHLFNAMGQMEHRTPNLVGAALDDGRLWAGLIADGFHVADAPMRVALRGKAGLAGMFLVSDAMSTIGSDLTEFTLNGRQIFRAGGRLTLADGTLAGADIALIDAVRYVHQSLMLPLGEALNLAALAPARAMGITDRGHLEKGAHADFVSLTPEITAASTWIGGRKVGGTA
ncbi:N-acetylglucosamine-6-phosphate deacetylase [Pacificibacter marinus]|uniref:N-acetylglucosamine-6-phosphate deacetylase n=1 Tax=Pacificibacter marinus TaxID=658057 RepID=A0A1Y5RBS8_9RHOB|nr:N-acetylglucosamine-6-phosphate deacetylase [Pacificibacter marinus]SEK28620.1 N-acetylglucosamine 6-phosphate deacetylase [Pacificibacter marinus]SLN10992.1 N-acetylglucosamine-6-phosphate deacetylase [Pacificibacter marinus]